MVPLWHLTVLIVLMAVCYTVTCIAAIGYPLEILSLPARYSNMTDFYVKNNTQCASPNSYLFAMIQLLVLTSCTTTSSVPCSKSLNNTADKYSRVMLCYPVNCILTQSGELFSCKHMIHGFSYGMSGREIRINLLRI